MNRDKRPIRLFNIYGRKRGASFSGNVYSSKGIAPTLNTMGGGGINRITLSVLKEYARLLTAGSHLNADWMTLIYEENAIQDVTISKRDK